MKQLTKQLPAFLRNYKIHLISWGAFIAYEVLVVGLIAGFFASFWDYFVHYAINITLFYLHASLVLPLVLQRRGARRWLLPLLVAAEVLSYLAVTYSVEIVATRYFGLQLTRPLVLDHLYVVRSVWRAIYFMGFSTGYYYLITTIKERRRADQAERQQLFEAIAKQQLQHELAIARNSYLKAQINPHFLFNTLSFVYNSVRKTSPEASEAVLSLSEMMCYALQSEDEQQETSLLEEVAHVENLIYLHQVRHDHSLQVQLICGDGLAGVRVIPLVLATLVENVFQHGDLTNKAHPAIITVGYEEEELRITTSNLMKRENSAGHQVGHRNIRSRLRHAYGDRARFLAYTTSACCFHTEVSVASGRGDLSKAPAAEHLTPALF